MEKKVFWRSLWLALIISTTPFNAGAQDLKSILTGVAKAVVGDKATTASSVVGTWTYVGPACQFESENLLAKAGGEVASQKVEAEMKTVLDKVGMADCQYTFNADGTYSYTIKKKTTKGTYTFDDKAKTITMTTRLKIKTVAHVTVTGNSMSLVFKADKLMAALKVITNATAKVNTTAATINSVAGQYDGLMLGFELKK